MFSEVRSRLQQADSELRSRFTQRGGDEPVTQSEVSELKLAVSALRKHLQHIVEDEIAQNNEACGVAANGMILLRNERDGERHQRDELRGKLEDAKSELAQMENRCSQENEQRETCRDDVVRMQGDTEQARKEMINLHAEMKQMTFFQDDVDAETKYRLRADVQNLETERERDEIRLRRLNTDRSGLRSELERLQSERDALQYVANERQKELSEAKMTQDMYRAHQEALTIHLQNLGGDPRNIFGSLTAGNIHSFRGFFKGRRIREFVDEMTQESIAIIPKKKDDRSLKKDNKQQPGRSKIDRVQPEKSKHSPQVGGIVLGADTAEGSTDFLRKLPTIFKMGASSNNDNVQEYVSKKEREVEFASDSHSISAISVITCDDDAWSIDSNLDEPS
mmetsp:Transcript_20132/g.43728  ORF Transcript_20132/g.43728 Transcript_20132/m.43728 type:complete len:393 (-) Transcript_20132:65-1243(-)|eukprot:CAMPEP_0172318424 /NCGR_PEP_ID=MMETSP1058-20130122/34825_1 /TAXON_ID=83371 /ORGANISM="Detonula confervacea, Strain CCMP 353" /LENGTH=392 /DNA_ID=CAMNT_0013033255 /DNA_START=100 /DNA_END=1278 /DNA_ORIENTATION=+